MTKSHSHSLLPLYSATSSCSDSDHIPFPTWLNGPRNDRSARKHEVTELKRDSSMMSSRSPSISASASTTAATAEHVCHCGRRFLRKEHLQRHKAVHEAPSFVCRICQRSFTRKQVSIRTSPYAEHWLTARKATFSDVISPVMRL